MGLCRDHFSNCRADMIDAAYCALVEEDPQHMLPPAVRLRFVAMKVAAEGLYSSTFTKSTFTGDLDVIVKDTMEKSKQHAEVGEYSLVKTANLEKVGKIEI